MPPCLSAGTAANDPRRKSNGFPTPSGYEPAFIVPAILFANVRWRSRNVPFAGSRIECCLGEL